MCAALPSRNTTFALFELCAGGSSSGISSSRTSTWMNDVLIDERQMQRGGRIDFRQHRAANARHRLASTYHSSHASLRSMSRDAVDESSTWQTRSVYRSPPKAKVLPGMVICVVGGSAASDTTFKPAMNRMQMMLINFFMRIQVLSKCWYRYRIDPFLLPCAGASRQKDWRAEYCESNQRQGVDHV